MQPEFHLAGSLAQWRKTPTTVHTLEWTIAQGDIHPAWNFLGVLGGKIRFDALEIDMYATCRQIFGSFQQFSSVAPGKKFWVILDPVDQIEHLGHAIFDQNGFFNNGHLGSLR